MSIGKNSLTICCKRWHVAKTNSLDIIYKISTALACELFETVAKRN